MNQQDQQEAAVVAVMQDVIRERLGGDARLFKRWAANNNSFLNYAIGLKRAELAGSTGGDVVDTSTLARGVRAAQSPWVQLNTPSSPGRGDRPSGIYPPRHFTTQLAPLHHLFNLADYTSNTKEDICLQLI